MEKYTEEQQDILKNIFKYQSKAELTKEEIQEVLDMFKNPERFVILRKIFQIFTSEERDIQIPSEEALIDTNPGELNKYGLQVAINMRADEKIRQSLLSFYSKVKTWHVSAKEKEFDAEIELEKAEEQKHEELQAREELSKKKVGDNV